MEESEHEKATAISEKVSMQKSLEGGKPERENGTLPSDSGKEKEQKGQKRHCKRPSMWFVPGTVK